jgi:hypothetical protein
LKTIRNSHKGQTIIETALMIMLLFILFFGIAEIARFWWLKNQVNNAARVGVRVAVVDTSTFFQNTGESTSPSCTAFAYSASATCSYSAGVCNAGTPTAGAPLGPFQAACSSITNSILCGGATVELGVTPVDSDGACDTSGIIVSPGGIITVNVTSPPIGTIVPGLASLSLGLIPVDSSGNITLASQSTMRHE